MFLMELVGRTELGLLLKKLRLSKRQLCGPCSRFVLWNFRPNGAVMLTICCRSWQGCPGAKHSTLTFCPRPALHILQGDTLWTHWVEADTNTSPSLCIYRAMCVHILEVFKRANFLNCSLFAFKEGIMNQLLLILLSIQINVRTVITLMSSIIINSDSTKLKNIEFYTQLNFI